MCVCVCVLAYEQAVEDQKLRMELSQLKRETDKYLENYELSKQVTAIIDRKRKKGKDLLEVSEKNDYNNHNNIFIDSTLEEELNRIKLLRTFHSLLPLTTPLQPRPQLVLESVSIY